jgi:hypothetical protein
LNQGAGNTENEAGMSRIFLLPALEINAALKHAVGPHEDDAGNVAIISSWSSTCVSSEQHHVKTTISLHSPFAFQSSLSLPGHTRNPERNALQRCYSDTR